MRNEEGETMKKMQHEGEFSQMLHLLLSITKNQF